LETYVQNGLVHDKASAKSFIVQMLSQNIQYTDAAFVSLAYDAASQSDLAEIKILDEECTALKLPREIRQASQKLGTRLLKIFGVVAGNKLVEQLREDIEEGTTDGNYAIVFGTLAAAFQMKKSEALTGFYYNAAAGMVTNSVKLVPLGQQDGQEILFSLQQLITTLVDKSLVPDRELVGLCCPGFDIRCMQHERLYSRLYMS
jgi:urease accessory protein